MSARVEIKNAAAVMCESLNSHQQTVTNLLTELEEERSSAATAASEAMSMILRLQREKAEMQMEFRQFKRFAEEKMAHDQEEILAFEDLLSKRDQAVQALNYEVQAYKRKQLTQAERSPRSGGWWALQSSEEKPEEVKAEEVKPEVVAKAVEVKPEEVVKTVDPVQQQYLNEKLNSDTRGSFMVSLPPKFLAVRSPAPISILASHQQYLQDMGPVTHEGAHPSTEAIAAPAKSVLGSDVAKNVLMQWSNQGIRFSSDPETSMGLVQHERGPCSVLATLQANVKLIRCDTED